MRCQFRLVARFASIVLLVWSQSLTAEVVVPIGGGLATNTQGGLYVLTPGGVGVPIGHRPPPTTTPVPGAPGVPTGSSTSDYSNTYDREERQQNPPPVMHSSSTYVPGRKRSSGGPVIRRDSCSPKMIIFDPETGQSREICPPHAR